MVINIFVDEKLLLKVNLISAWMTLANRDAAPVNLMLLKLGKQMTKLHQNFSFSFFPQGKGTISLQVFPQRLILTGTIPHNKLTKFPAEVKNSGI